MTRIRVSVPARAAPDEVVNIKAMIQHDMESGYRRDAMGEVIPRNIITRFECLYNLSLIHISEPTRLRRKSRMPSSA